MRISVIVPALDEADAIGALLHALQPLRAAGGELIVVDGGSRDATAAVAAPLADRIVVAARGRASQLNAGAAVATGGVLLFVHADSRLQAADAAAMPSRLASSRRRWGRFDVAIEGRSRLLPMVAATMNARSRLTGIATGDQAMFVERGLFEAVGGFPLQPLMEDVELSRRLKRAAGRPLCVRGPVRTSGRRWDANGAWRTIAAMWRLRFDYWRGVRADDLARRYAALRARVCRDRAPTLQVFARAPVHGTVKTRIAATEGAERALALHCALVERTLATACAAREAGVAGAVELWGAPGIDAPEFAAWSARFGVEVKSQCDGDLGARMRGALRAALARGERAILIGTDCPALDVDYVRAASKALDRHDAVFGPAEDGGYVLVGLARDANVFDGIAWGTPEVMEQTRRALRATAVRWKELRPLWDVDRAEDVRRWDAAPKTC
jgi:rSAM/selenodomain-associated transferase 2/rSAM/selenodomain-associated transferase 1